MWTQVKTTKNIAQLFLLPLLITLLTACEERDVQHSTPQEAVKIRVGGSTTLSPVIRELAANFSKKRPNLEFDTSESSSGGGYTKLLQGDLDIACMSRSLTVKDLQESEAQNLMLDIFPVGSDAITLVVHPDRQNDLAYLTREQLVGIFFTETITDWRQISDSYEGPIVPYTGDSKSGTTVIFCSIINKSDPAELNQRVIRCESTLQSLKKLESDPNGISFGGFVTVSEMSLHALGYGEDEQEIVACTPKNIASHRYRLARPLQLVVRADADLNITEYIVYLLSSEGQDTISKYGFTPIR